MIRRFLQGAAALMLVVCPAWAAGYDHFALGMAASNRGDGDIAISEFTAALGAGDLSPGLVPVAYLDRGLAYVQKDKCAEAAADSASALALKPDYLDALSLRAGASICAGDYAAAIADYQIIIAKHPGAGYLREEAFAYWMSGDFANAAQVFQKVTELEPHYAYGVLWLEIVRMRSGSREATQMAHDMSGVDSADWPRPLLDLYLGKSKPEDVMVVAAKGDAQTVKNQQCEANFYIAEWWFSQNQPVKAWPLLGDAYANCPKDYFEYRLAKEELKHPH